MQNKAVIFEFTSCLLEVKSRQAIFTYRVYFDDKSHKEYVETLILPLEISEDIVSNPDVKKILSDVHIALGTSYYKMYCPKEIRIKTGQLSKQDAQFWNTVYTKGLGQFYYENKIDFRGLINFPADANAIVGKPFGNNLHTNPNKILLAFGGGKDSLLSNTLLNKDHTINVTAFSLRQNNTLNYIANKNNLEYLVVDRILDSKLFELNKLETVLNGHVPITVINSFVSLLVAVLYGFGTIIFSNEASSNYGNVVYLGQEINHQWGKTSEFEEIMQTHIQQTIHIDLEYFSLIRPFHEIEIVRRFINAGIDLSSFTSCNRDFKIEITSSQTRLWCGECPKCVFMFMLLSAFLKKDEVVKLFNKNLYDEASLSQLFKDILGVGTMKPFECVGTPEEAIVAMHKSFLTHEYDDEPIMKMFVKDVLPTITSIEKLEKLVFSYGDDSLMHEKFKKLLV